MDGLWPVGSVLYQADLMRDEQCNCTKVEVGSPKSIKEMHAFLIRNLGRVPALKAS